MIFSGSDFNVKSQIMRLHQSLGKSHHASWQTRLFSIHGLSSHDYFSSLRCQAQRRSQGQRLLLLRPVLGDVFCSTHISRVASRHRNEFESPRGKVLSSWLSMFEHFSQYIVQCQRNSSLANLRRFCAALDWTCPTLVCKRSACNRFGRDGLRIRRHYDRSLLVGLLPLGTVSNDQSGGEDAYVVGSLRLHTHFHSYFRWKDSRSQHLGSLGYRAWSLLPDGSWVLGFRSPLCGSPSSSFLCHSSQKQHEVQAPIFSSNRQREQQHYLRSNRYDDHFLFQQGLPQYIAKSNRQRRTRGKKLLLDKKFRPQAPTDCRSLSAKVATQVVLQMDKTAFKNKELYRDNRERRQDSNLDRSLHICIDCNHEKKTSFGTNYV